MAIVVLLWLVLVFAGIKYIEDVRGALAFGKDTSLALRGVCSIEIMMGHLGLATGSVVLFPNRKAGILFVGIFFALSGYGLMYSLQNKENYLHGFLVNRLSKLLIPAYLIYAIGVLLKAPLGWMDIFRPDKFFAKTNWYVWEMAGMYIAFYICARLTDLKKSHIILLLLTLAFVFTAYAVKLDRPWYGSSFCFWLGIFYFVKRDSFREVLVLKHGGVLNIVIFGLLMIISMGLFFIKEDWIIGDLVGRNIASVSFTVIVIICLHRFRLGNPVSLWLGRYSYEIFLFHPVFIALLRPYIINDVMYALLVISFTIIAAWVYRTFADLIKDRV